MGLSPFLRAPGGDFRRLLSATAGPAIGRVAALGNRFLDAVLPSMCLECDRPCIEGDWRPFLCAQCGEEVDLWDRALEVDSGRSARVHLLFAGPVRAVVHALKYQGNTVAGARLGQMMRQSACGESLVGADIVIPVPLHWRRRWARGHNQVMAIARGFVRAGSAPGHCDDDGGDDPSGTGGRGVGPQVLHALRRVRSTRPQVGLSGRDRRANMRGAFVVCERHRAAVRGATIVLLDDVITTGATVSSAAETLERAGAASVRICAVAVAPATVGGLPRAHG